MKRERPSSEDFLAGLERSPDRWNRKSKALWESAKTIELGLSKAYQAAPHDEDLIDVLSVSAMLRAMSIECILKAIHYQRELNPPNSKHLREAIDHRIHDLRKLAAGVLNISLSDDDAEYLDALTTMIYLGRYPAHVARDKKGKIDTDPKTGNYKAWVDPFSNSLVDLGFRKRFQALFEGESGVSSSVP